MSNPLVAQAQSQTTAVTGIGIAESAVDLANGVKDGSWVEFGMGALGVGMEALSMVMDPIGTLAQYGASWLIEHVQPLKEALDWLAGDPPVIQSYADTWANVAGEVGAVAGELSNEAKNGTAGWTGEGGDAYRQHVAQQTDAIAGASTLADGISTGVMVMGQVVAMVRETVRDLVAELVGKLISWVLEEACTLGFATPLVAAQATTAITNTISKVSDLVRKLVKTIGNVSPKIRKIVDKLGEIIEKLSKLGKKFTRRADGATTPSAAHTANKLDGPDVHAPDTPNSPDGPDVSGTGTHGDGTSPSSSTADTSPNRPADPADTKTPENARTCENDPIDVATGEMVLGQTDVELPGVLPLVLRRTHVSSCRAGRSHGRSWASTVDQRLEFDARGVVYVAEDGMVLVYPAPPASGAVLPEMGPRWPLSRTGDGFVIERRESGQWLHFLGGDGVRPLSATTDRNGNRIDFDRDAAGALTGIRHSGGYELGVETDAGLITELRLHNTHGEEISLVSYRYDDAGRLAAVVNSSGAELKFDYDLAGRITQWTDRNGEWYRYFYDERGRCVANQGSGGFLNGTFSYEEGVTRFTDALGHVTVYRVNDRRQVVAETDPLGNTTTQEWDEFDRLLSRTDPLGRTTSYRYDDAGNLTTITRADGTQSLAEYREPGLLAAVVDADGGVWRYDYDEHGNLSMETDPSGAVTRYSYDEHGAVATVTDALGHVKTVVNDGAGLPIAVTEPGGGSTRYARDQFGRVSAITDPLGGVTRLGWTVEGQLTSRTEPDGTWQRWQFDGEGNLVSHVDELGQVTTTRITHFDLPLLETRPDGSRLEFGYDPNLRLISITNAHGLAWRYSYDAAGNLVSETDFDGRTIQYAYDAAGQLVSRVNGAGQLVHVVHDLVGQVVERRSADDVSRYEFDPAGRLVRAVNRDAELVVERDALGRVLAETVNGRTVRSWYDALGRRIGRRTPTGVVSAWSFDSDGRPEQLRTGSRSISFGYDGAGREVERLIDNGTILAQAWDANHRLTSQTVSVLDRTSARQARTLQQRNYRYRSGGQVTGVEDRLGGTRRFELDPAGRVTGVQAGSWWERYSYDAAGNIAHGGSADEGSGNREYSGTLLRDSPRVRYQHDAQGRVVVRQRKRLSRKPDTWHYTWDADDRLVGVVTPDGARWRYRYDPLGRRIAKERLAADGSPAERVDFAWDGLVLAEQAETGGRATAWEWAPDEFRPLAQVERVHSGEADQQWVDREFYAIVTDLVGAPAELVDSAGRLAWRADADLWGRGLNPSTGQGTPLRFPGQYHDAETGLHYNFHRTYDPETGQYTSGDPLGLRGGPNPHAYVPNPVQWLDPLGLTPCAVKQKWAQKADFSNDKVLNKKYDKHAADFGITGNKNNANKAAFVQAMKDHMTDPNTKIYRFNYRNQGPAVGFIDPGSGKMVMLRSDGTFWSAWKLGNNQFTNIVDNGRL